MNILNARLRGRSGLYRIELDGARIAAISAQQAPAEASEGDSLGGMDARSMKATAAAASSRP